MAKIEVDRDKCVGCGLCASLCPDCFELDGEGKSKVIKQDCGSCNPEEVAGECPVQAITVKK